MTHTSQNLDDARSTRGKEVKKAFSHLTREDTLFIQNLSSPANQSGKVLQIVFDQPNSHCCLCWWSVMWNGFNTWKQYLEYQKIRTFYF